MTRSIGNRYLSLGLAVALLAGVAFSGCSDRGFSTAPANPPTRAGHASGPAPDGTGVGVGPVRPDDSTTRTPDEVKTIPMPTTLDVVEASGILEPGKTLTIKAGAFELEVPPGAAPAGTVIVVRDISGAIGRVSCELLPHGLQFVAPVRLTARLPEGYDPFVFILFYVADEGTSTESWQPLATRVSETGGSIEAFLKHFSSYAPGSVDGKAGWGPIRNSERIESSHR